MLGSRERLVGRAGEHVGALVERVLELSARDEAHHMCAVVPDVAAGFLERVLQVPQRRREQEDTLPERGDLRLHEPEQLRRPVDVDVHPLDVEGIVHVVHPAHPRGPELRGADVGPVAQGHGRHDVPRFEEGKVHGHVRDRAADEPRVHVPHAEDLFRQGDDAVLDLVDERVPLVVPFVRQAFRVSVAEVRHEHLPGHRADHVLRGDHGEGLREPGVMAVHLFVEERDVLVHSTTSSRKPRNG